jgi:hypothetical protein
VIKEEGAPEAPKPRSPRSRKLKRRHRRRGSQRSPHLLWKKRRQCLFWLRRPPACWQRSLALTLVQ